jgi:hypothetical protein
MNGIQKVIVGILAIGILSIIAILIYVFLGNYTQPIPTPIAIAITDTFTDTFTPEPSSTNFPATWTPAPTFLPSLTETFISSPTSILAETPVPVSLNQPAKFSGNWGSSFSILLPMSNFTFTWKYKGSPSAGKVPASEVKYHQDMLTYINNKYDNLVYYYKERIYEDTIYGDVMDIAICSHEIASLNTQRDQELQQENTRYAGAAQNYSDKTQFVLYTYLSTTNKKTLASCMGANSGIATFQSTGGIQVFTVLASGPWDVTVTELK